MEINTAIEVAARIWCDPEYSHVVMNPELAMEIAEMLLEEANFQEVNNKQVLSKSVLRRIAIQKGLDQYEIVNG